MKDQRIGRRDFLETAALGAGGIVLGGPLNALTANSARLKIEEPFHGAVLNHRHGKSVDGGLAIQVSGTAPADERVLVCGREAERHGEKFAAEVVLRQGETNITATSNGSSGRQEDQVRVVWDRHSFARYRFSIDDNSFFLRDIFRKEYHSPNPRVRIVLNRKRPMPAAGLIFRANLQPVVNRKSMLLQQQHGRA